MKTRDIELDKIKYYFVLSKEEKKSLKKIIKLAQKTELTQEEKKEKQEHCSFLLEAVKREDNIFKKINTIRANAKDGKRSEWMKSIFLTKAINKALEKDFENVTTYKTVNFIRSFYELESKYFNKNNKRTLKYKIGKKLNALNLRQLHQYIYYKY
jgi:hypothetical protein